MRSSFHIAFLLSAMLLLASCGKDYDRFSINQVSTDTTWKSPTAISNDLQSLFDSIALKPMTIEVANIATMDTLFFPGSAALMIQERSCQTPGGAVATGGAKVELTLLRTKGEFIRNSKPTCSSRSPLLTNAIANVRILQNGTELKLKSGASIVVSFPASNPAADLKTFYAEPTSPDRPYVEWTLAADGAQTLPFARPIPGMMGQYVTGYDLKLTQLRWVNCGGFGDTTRPDNLSVTLPLNFTNANTAVFIVLRDHPSVIQMDAEPRHQYFHTGKVPDGQSLKAVTISYYNGEYYVGSTDAVSAEGTNIVVKPEKKSLTELLAFLGGL